MHRIIWCAILALCVALNSTLIVNAQSGRIRGMIESVDGQYLTVRARDGSSVKVLVSDNARIVEVIDSSMDEIKPGSFVGLTSQLQPDGTQEALQVSIFPESIVGTGVNVRLWDLAPGSTMTNTTIDAKVASVDGDVLTVKYKDGEKKVTVPVNTTIISFVNSNMNRIKPGINVFIANATRQPDGIYLASRVTINKSAVDRASSKETGCQITSAGISCGGPSGSLQLADHLSKKLRELPSKYNKPGTLFLGSSIPVQFVLQTTDKSIDEMFKGFPGDITTAKVQVAENVSAYLSGPKDMIEIALRGEPRRAITSAGPVSWVWDVRPLKPGHAQVTLEVFSHIKIDNEDHNAQIRVLQDTWVTEARGLEWVKYEISQVEPVQAFLFALISGIGGVVAYFGLKVGKPKKSYDDLS
jgi:hypothetical protein